MSVWTKYHLAVMAILKLIQNTVPLSDLQRRRIAEAQELVEAVGDIMRLEEEGDSDAGDTDDDEFISLQDEDAADEDNAALI